MEAFARDGRVTSAFRPTPLEKASDLDWPALSLTEVFLFARFHISLHHLLGARVRYGLGAHFRLEVALRMMNCLKSHRSSRRRAFFIFCSELLSIFASPFGCDSATWLRCSLPPLSSPSDEELPEIAPFLSPKGEILEVWRTRYALWQDQSQKPQPSTEKMPSVSK